MARTIQSALKQMIEKNVNMPPDRVKRARISRDWLLERIENFEKNKQHLYFCKKFRGCTRLALNPTPIPQDF